MFYFAFLKPLCSTLRLWTHIQSLRAWENHGCFYSGDSIIFACIDDVLAENLNGDDLTADAGPHLYKNNALDRTWNQIKKFVGVCTYVLEGEVGSKHRRLVVAGSEMFIFALK